MVKTYAKIQIQIDSCLVSKQTTSYPSLSLKHYKDSIRFCIMNTITFYSTGTYLEISITLAILLT